MVNQKLIKQMKVNKWLINILNIQNKVNLEIYYKNKIKIYKQKKLKN